MRFLSIYVQVLGIHFCAYLYLKVVKIFHALDWNCLSEFIVQHLIIAILVKHKKIKNAFGSSIAL